jgi:large subunit ribosomal protein L16
MLIPKKIKHRKWHKGRRRNLGQASRLLDLSFGKYGLKVTSHHWISSRQIEAARRVITRYTKKGGKYWIRIFPDKPVTQKGEQATMGSGKGAVEYYAFVAKPGAILFEMDGVEEKVAKEALRLAGHKLPVTTRVITKD